jgi:acylglycerol lipase
MNLVRDQIRTADGLTLHASDWYPTGETRASVVLIHGYGEHSGRYDHVARALGSSGVAVHSFDLRGMGRSEGRRGRIDSFDILANDMETAIMRSHTPSLPLFLLGHSFGGLLVIHHIMTTSRAYAGVILSAPAFLPRPVLPRPLYPLLSAAARITPALPVMSIRRRLLSRDPDVVTAARMDRLNTGSRIDARTASEFAAAGRAALRRVDDVSVPLLIIQGSDDGIVDARGAYFLYEHAPSDDKTLTVFEGGYHEPFHDLIADEAIGRVVEWITERTD